VRFFFKCEGCDTTLAAVFWLEINLSMLGLTFRYHKEKTLRLAPPSPRPAATATNVKRLQKLIDCHQESDTISGKHLMVSLRFQKAGCAEGYTKIWFTLFSLPCTCSRLTGSLGLNDFFQPDLPL
jgi:hypothetical protein